MSGYETLNRNNAQPTRAIRVRLEVFFVAALIVLMAFPAFGMVKKATTGMSCVRTAIQTTNATCSKP